MTDRSDFESALEARLIARAATASRPFDPAEIARQVVDQRSRSRLSWPTSGAARYWPILALLLLAAVAVAAGIGALRRASLPLPSDAVSNGSVVAAANPWSYGAGDNADLYLMTGDGAARRIVGLENDGIAQQCPAFSPDGRALAYGEAKASVGDGGQRGPFTVKDRAVVVADVDASGGSPVPRLRVPIAAPGTIVCPAWSPRGDRLAFRDGENLWIVDRASGATRQWPIAGVAGRVSNELAWSHDGRLIAVAEYTHIRILDVDTGDVTMLPIPGGAPSSLGWTAGDKGLIAIAMVPVDELGTAIYLFDPTTGGRRQLTQKATQPGVTYSFASATVSPDGRRVAYLQSSSSCSSDGCGSVPLLPPIAIEDLDDTTSTGLGTPADDTGADPLHAAGIVRWSPDGSRLLISSFLGIASVDPASKASMVRYTGGTPSLGLNLEWSFPEVSWQPVPR